jgi:hypothetical protein
LFSVTRGSNIEWISFRPFARFSASIADDEPARAVIAGLGAVELRENRRKRFGCKRNERFDECALASPDRTELVVTKIVEAWHIFLPRR